MIWKGKDRRTVFILGAGATRGAISHVLVKQKRVKSPLNGDFFKIAETFVRALGGNSSLRSKYARLIKVFKSEIPIKGRLPTMEEAFTLLYLSKDFPEIYAHGPGRPRSPGARREIRDFLILTFKILATISRTNDPTLFDELVSKLRENDTLITLNYDTMLDSALVRAGWDPRKGYNLIGGSSKIKWTPPSGMPPASRCADVRLLKLHGSLNWFVRGSYNKLSRVFDSKPSLVTEPRTNEINGMIRQIVPPIYGKFFGHDHWQRLWNKAYSALLDAELIVVIGCSLVDTDFHLRALLGRVVATRRAKNRPISYGILVDQLKIRKKWKRTFGSVLRSTSTFRRFEDFAREIR